METSTMFFVKLHLFILTLYALWILISAAHCQKGQRVVTGKHQGCEDCTKGYFQETINYSQSCNVCRKCDRESGSDVAQPCTRTSNTICKCRKGFVASDSDFSTCKCDAGFGKKSGECTECADGHFSKSINSPCQKWKECKFGVNITGTKTSDVICNDVKHSDANASPTPGRAVSTDQPREKVPIQKLLTTSATTMTTLRRIPHSDTSSPSRTADSVGFLVTFVTVGLLLLTAVIIKLYIIFHMEKHESVQQHESTCGRPVEEIGGGSEVCLKLTLEEP